MIAMLANTLSFSFPLCLSLSEPSSCQTGEVHTEQALPLKTWLSSVWVGDARYPVAGTVTTKHCLNVGSPLARSIPSVWLQLLNFYFFLFLFFWPDESPKRPCKNSKTHATDRYNLF